MSGVTTSALAGSFQRSSRADKEGDMSSVERDAGFCSGGDDEDLDDLHSPTDVSEDSVEVKVQPICLRNKNKRKCAEPRKVASEDITSRTPYKKRRHFIQQEQQEVPSDLILPVDRYHVTPSSKSEPLLVEEDVTAAASSRSSGSPFRPWSHHRPSSLSSERRPSSTPSPLPRCSSAQASPPPPQYTERVPELPNQDEPLSLVLKTEDGCAERTHEDVRRGERSHSELKLCIKREHPHERLLESVRHLAESNFSSMPVPVPLRMGGGRVEDVRRVELSGVREDFKRLQYGSGVIFKREPEQFERHPFAMSLPADGGARIQRHSAVDFSSAPGPSRASEASCSYTRGSDVPRSRRTLSEMANEDRVMCDVEDLSGRKFNVQSMLTGRCNDDLAGPSSSASTTSDKKTSPGGSQRNYKNMTRERRIEANARERTRVHTISAAFDTLRRTIPAYSHNQKLSKLSVLRIACSYILTLSRVAGTDYSSDGSEPSLADCVDMVSRTIQTEGKLRKKKDE